MNLTLTASAPYQQRRAVADVASFEAAICAAQREIAARYNIASEDMLTITPTVQDVRRHLGLRSKGSLYEGRWRGLVEAARGEGRIAG